MSEQKAQLNHLWGLAHGEISALERVALVGEEPVLPSIYKVGVQAQAAIGAAGLAAAEMHRARTGVKQEISVDMRHAAAAFRSENYVRINGEKVRMDFDPIHGFYKCGAGGWVQVHANYPAHRMGVVELLRC